MTFQQAILRFIYPFLLFINKLLPAKDASLTNLNNKLPLKSLYTIQVMANNNDSLLLEKYKGKKLLLVNTASNCGYTAQYDELETLYKRYKDKLVIIAFPSNDFRGQEPHTDSTIAQFCKLNYGVTFPVMKKGKVLKGENQTEIYQWLTDDSKNGWCKKEPTWNFCKYLINEEGTLTHFFKQGVSPLDKRVIEAIEK